MAAPRRVIELAIGADDLARLETIARSRTEPASRVERARILLAYRAEPSSTAVGARIGVTHHTVQRCLRRAVRLGVMAALDDSPRPGKAPQITARSESLAGVAGLPKGQGLRLSARTVDHAAAGAACPRARRRLPDIPAWRSIVQGTVCKILAAPRNQAAQGSLLPRTPRRSVRRQDGRGALRLSRGRRPASASETPAPTSPSSPMTRSPAFRRSATPRPTCRRNPDRTRRFARDHEYKRHGTLSLLAGIDLLTGQRARPH